MCFPAINATQPRRLIIWCRGIDLCVRRSIYCTIVYIVLYVTILHYSPLHSLYYSVLHCTVLYYIVLYCTGATILHCSTRCHTYTIPHCIVLNCIALLNCTAMYCTVLYCIILHCSVLILHVLSCILQHCTNKCYYIVLYILVVHGAITYCTELHYIALLNCTEMYCS